MTKCSKCHTNAVLIYKKFQDLELEFIEFLKQTASEETKELLDLRVMEIRIGSPVETLKKNGKVYRPTLSTKPKVVYPKGAQPKTPAGPKPDTRPQARGDSVGSGMSGLNQEEEDEV